MDIFEGVNKFVSDHGGFDKCSYIITAMEPEL